MDSSIGPVGIPRGLPAISERNGGNRKNGREFRRALDEQPAGGAAPKDAPRESDASVPPALQQNPVDGRKDDSGGSRHVDVIA